MNILEKLWDTIINNGLGGLLKPWQIERVGLAEAKTQRKKMLIVAQTEIDILKVKNGTLTINDDGNKSISEDLLDILLSDEKLQILKRKTNFLKALDKTFLMLETNLEKCDESSEKPSAEWFDRWREYSEKANTEEVQELWARILNQEIRYGGSISLRTLDFLRSISTNEAKLIEKVFTLEHRKMLIYYVTNSRSDWSGESNSFLPKIGITPRAMAALEYLGIIEGVNTLGVVTEIHSSFDDMYLIKIKIDDNTITITNKSKDSKIVVHAYQFTVLGLELMKILRLKRDIEYFNLLFGSLKVYGFEIQTE
jgi:hypothetical protein